MTKQDHNALAVFEQARAVVTHPSRVTRQSHPTARFNMSRLLCHLSRRSTAFLSCNRALRSLGYLRRLEHPDLFQSSSIIHINSILSTAIPILTLIRARPFHRHGMTLPSSIHPSEADTMKCRPPLPRRVRPQPTIRIITEDHSHRILSRSIDCRLQQVSRAAVDIATLCILPFLLSTLYL